MLHAQKLLLMFAQVGRLVVQVADKSQIGTQRIGSRPYGVGLLVVGQDQTGPHLFETQPSGQYFEYKGIAIGARSQAGRTYLEKHFESFGPLTVPELITHALIALRETLATGTELSSSNVAVGYTSADQGFTILEDDLILPYINALKQQSEATEAPPDGEPTAAEAAPAASMDTDP